MFFHTKEGSNMAKRTKIIKTPTLKAGLDQTSMVPDVYIVRIRRPSEMPIKDCIYNIRNAVFDRFNEAEDIKVCRDPTRV
jgi:hypothetical protein